jgi:hypothetical protein
MSDRPFLLPPKVESYLATLNRLYQRNGEIVLRNVIVNGIVSVHEEWDYDNWNGGPYGHAITFTIPEDLYLELFETRDAIQDRIAADLSKLDNSPNEHISAVFVEMNPSESDRWREESGILRQRMAPSSISAEALQRIWGPRHVKLFLSHKSSVKADVTKLKQSLAKCGIAAFVAHEDIEPTQEWQREIERALFSMDALAALLTQDYHDSEWTDQEVGVAIGRGVPLVAVRLECDPYGLMGKGQGLGGCTWSDPDSAAIKIFHTLRKCLQDKSRLIECAIAAYSESRSWEESVWRIEQLLSMFESLTSDQVTRVIEAYRANEKNKKSFKGMELLKPLLEKWTKKEWMVVDNELVLAADEVDPFETPELPF